MHERTSVLLTVLLLAVAYVPVTIASAADSEFLRIRYDRNGEPAALQSAIASYRAPTGAAFTGTVDLIGALHIAEKTYFAELNDRFRHYDAVLYELIAAPGTRIPRGGPDNPGSLASTQVAIKNALGLSFQLDEVNYNVSNFVHADMSPEQFSQSMAERNENLYQYFWKIFFFATKQYARDPLGERQADLFAALFADDNGRALKIELARELLDVDRVTESLEGPDGSTLISGRNEQAINVLRQRIAAGDRRLAIFYGAGHLADLEARLADEFHMIKAEQTWLDAWDLSAGKNKPQ
ncbi:MAG: hypothetical protein KJO31_16195 [Gammaproteobacteria bacterium]|nr:hypothetical protein [Gammaproteobacteria bacterium]